MTDRTAALEAAQPCNDCGVVYPAPHLSGCISRVDEGYDPLSEDVVAKAREMQRYVTPKKGELYGALADEIEMLRARLAVLQALNGQVPVYRSMP